MKRLVADQALDIQNLKEVNSKKMVSPMQKRTAVEHVISMGQSSRSRACRLVGLARSSAYYWSDIGLDNLRKEVLIEEMSRTNPVYGYWKATALLS